MELLGLREIQLAELEILKEFDRVCRENGLNYSLSSGSLLGAIRHKGMIPWDDDIDVEMPRPDYEKFYALLSGGKAFNDGKYRIAYDRGKGAKYNWLKIIDTSYRTDTPILCDGCIGLFLDVFPVDGIGRTEKEAAKNIKKMRRLKRLLVFHWFTLSEYVGFEKFKRIIYRAYARLYNPDKLIEKIWNIVSSCPYENAAYYGVYGFRHPLLFSREQMENTADYEFEGGVYRGFADYDGYLSKMYGDYMTPPPEDERAVHGFTCYKK